MPRIIGFAGGAAINVDVGPSVPNFTGTIPTLSATLDTGTQQFDLGAYFSGADSYAIAPAVEAGWSFNTSTGELTIDTDEDGTFGAFTVTATNAQGSTPSNAFSVVVAAASGGVLHVTGRFKTPSMHARFLVAR